MPEDLLIVFESPCLLLWLQLLSKYCKTFRGKKERDRFSGIVYSKSETKNPVSALLVLATRYKGNWIQLVLAGIK